MVDGSDQALERFLRDFEDGKARPLADYVTPEGPASEAATPSPSRDGRIGGYRLIRELGRGAQGVVFLADDRELPRRVALKCMRSSGLFLEDEFSRFRREAEITSRLEARGICSIYEVGRDGNVPYIAMEYVPGETLRQRIAASAHDGAESVTIDFEVGDESTEETTAAPSDEAEDAARTSTVSRNDILAMVEIIEKAARALHFAHESGVIHRDIKPGNMMIRPDGEPVILDFGLARELEAGVTVSLTGGAVGTPAYMSPEQLAGQHLRLDRRTDLWSLAATLYEATTLTRPFAAETREGVYRQILMKEPPNPRKLSPSCPKDLATVIRTALDKDADRRYQTALELAEDLARIRRREPILARAPSLGTRVVRWGQRNPLVAGAIALALIGGFAAGFLVRADGALDQAEYATVHYRQWAEAIIEGREPAPEDDEVVRLFAPSPLYEELRDDAFSLVSYETFVRRVLDEARGEEEWLFPNGEGLRVAEPITFRVRDLTLNRRPDAPVTVRIGSFESVLKNVWQHEFQIEAPGTRRELGFSLPEGIVLESGESPTEERVYVWQIIVTDLQGRELPPSMAEFTLVSPSFGDEVRARVAETGSEDLDGLLRGGALAVAGLAVEALSELESVSVEALPASLAELHHRILIRTLTSIDLERARRLIREREDADEPADPK